jgi:hypothetical protein
MTICASMTLGVLALAIAFLCATGFLRYRQKRLGIAAWDTATTLGLFVTLWAALVMLGAATLGAVALTFGGRCML